MFVCMSLSIIISGVTVYCFYCKEKDQKLKIDQCEFNKRVNCLSRDVCETK